MWAERIAAGSTIGIFCPSHVGAEERYGPIVSTLEWLGFKVRRGANFHGDAYGYAGSAEGRAADLNALASDPEVAMVMFNGGESSAEILPYVDFEAIRRNPKPYVSYSDGTTILSAIRAQTGLVTYYGVSGGVFSDLRHYDYVQFKSHLVEGCLADDAIADIRLRPICGGSCDGELAGGYAPLFAFMLGSPYFRYDAGRRHLLFLEDHEIFSKVGSVATTLAFIGQSAFMKSVTGLLFGHYAASVPDDLYGLLARFGQAHGIPVAYTDDFGHGPRHAILPIGAEAIMDVGAGRIRLIG